MIKFSKKFKKKLNNSLRTPLLIPVILGLDWSDSGSQEPGIQGKERKP